MDMKNAPTIRKWEESSTSGWILSHAKKFSANPGSPVSAPERRVRPPRHGPRLRRRSSYHSEHVMMLESVRFREPHPPPRRHSCQGIGTLADPAISRLLRDILPM